MSFVDYELRSIQGTTITAGRGVDTRIQYSNRHVIQELHYSSTVQYCMRSVMGSLQGRHRHTVAAIKDLPKSVNFEFRNDISPNDVDWECHGPPLLRPGGDSMVRSNLNAVELRQKPKLLFLAPSASPQARKGRTGTSCVAVAAVPAPALL